MLIREALHYKDLFEDSESNHPSSLPIGYSSQALLSHSVRENVQLLSHHLIGEENWSDQV